MNQSRIRLSSTQPSNSLCRSTSRDIVSFRKYLSSIEICGTRMIEWLFGEHYARTSTERWTYLPLWPDLHHARAEALRKLPC